MKLKVRERKGKERKGKEGKGRDASELGAPLRKEARDACQCKKRNDRSHLNHFGAGSNSSAWTGNNVRNKILYVPFDERQREDLLNARSPSCANLKHGVDEVLQMG